MARKQEYRSFEQAREFVRSLGLTSYIKWKEYRKSGKKPKDIPSSPEDIYKEEWKGYGDWLGTGNIAAKNMVFRAFEQAREFVRSKQFKSIPEWNRYCKSGKKPKDIPAHPDTTYEEEEWKGWGDWLGTGTIASYNRKYKPFPEAREFMHSLGLKTTNEWGQYCKSGKKPKDIPAHPYRTYKNKGWNGWSDWLGNKNFGPKNNRWRPFKEAREFARSLKLKSFREWEQYCNSGKKPMDIPRGPSVIYKAEWISTEDFLGYEERTYWSIEKIKELLRSLLKDGLLESLAPDQLYHLLTTEGVLNLDPSNRHSELFKNFLQIQKNSEFKQALKDYAESDSEVPPKLSDYQNIGKDGEITELRTPEELAQMVNETDDPLSDLDKMMTTQKVLEQTHKLGSSFCVDVEKAKFQVFRQVKKLWKNAFEKEKEYDTVKQIKEEGFTGNAFHDRVIEMFLSDYNAIQEIREQRPKGYSFPKGDPTLMQSYMAYKIKTEPYFANFSGTGSGKTLSAILASRQIDSKMTVVICPNDVVDQWGGKEGKVGNIREAFKDSVVIKGKEAFNVVRDENKHQYLVLNYDKFSQDYSDIEIQKLAKQKIDLLILDEVHFVKLRDEKEASQRHDHIKTLRLLIKEKNPDSKVLVMTATPILNELMEGKSLLELLAAKEFTGLETHPNLHNAFAIYEQLSLVSIREKRSFADVKIHHSEVKAQVNGDTKQIIKHLRNNPLWIESILTEARIPEIIKKIDGKKTIIYTEYVTGITEQLSNAVEKAGYKYAVYTGQNKSGLEKFKDKEQDIQVLIASKPIGTGVDGLQYVCSNLVINILPWTHAQFEQLIGRLERISQKNTVDVFVIKASLQINDIDKLYNYDQLMRWNKILFKASLADCAVDGILPEGTLVTVAQATKALIAWIERLERNEISDVTRPDLQVPAELIAITQGEIERKPLTLGEFSKKIQKINTSKSETMFEHFKQHPEEWFEFHKQMEEDFKTKSIRPYEEIIKRIKHKYTSRMLKKIQIADFGCGKAYFAKEFGKDKVKSYDFIAVNDSVTQCDMKSVPDKSGSVDIAVFSLSLMCKNWADYIPEARRVLAPNGHLFIAEATKQLNERLAELLNILKIEGFELDKEPEEKAEFTFIEARKL
jgi:superfamily II DNA or RNA helicase